ncbi:MAG: hypothetical protein CMQ15_09320 [Gammaproteobacteria bacterium]|nr:hypothetical protein [Gammaproteobacteria bacterium]
MRCQVPHMRQIFRNLVVLSQLGFVSLGFAAEQSEQAQRDLAATSSAIEAIQSWLNEANTRQSDEEQSLKAAELALAAVSQSVTTLQTLINDTETELAVLQDRQESLANARAQQSKVLGQAIRAVYMSGNQNILKMLLNQEDLSEGARMLHYYRVFSESQLASIESYRSLIGEIDEVNQGLESRLSDLSQQRRNLDQQLVSLNDAKSSRETALAELNSDIASQRTELERLEINQAELQALIEEIRRAMEGIRSFADVPPFEEQQGTLAPPAEGPLISHFGSRYGDGNLTRQGITIGVSEGTPVRAIHPGQIVFADWLRGSGLLVIVDHGDGFMSLYGSNQALAMQAGEWVDGGEVLATSGNGGVANSPGLYFEIRLHGQAQNPTNWLRFQN